MNHEFFIFEEKYEAELKLLRQLLLIPNLVPILSNIIQYKNCK